MSYAVYVRRSSSPYNSRDYYTRRDSIIDDRPRDSAEPRRAAPTTAEANPVIGVFGLSVRTKERDLEDEFGKYGDVEKVVIVYDQRVSLVSFAPSELTSRLIDLEDSVSSL